ncbi:pectate lyase [Bacillus sp. ISL-18]|nr:pectate lyase [Bacillus sp. ISL-18]MBT2654579.1 pectate lyase [Bacillus sp. ISL-18]
MAGKKVLRIYFMCSLVLSLLAGGLGGFANTMVHAASPSIINSGGWYETAYIEWAPVGNAVGYNVYVKPASAPESQYKRIDNELIRSYGSFWRADAVGLAAGDYIMKVVAVLSDNSIVNIVSNILSVKAHDRTGFAFASNSTYGTGSGAYNEDGTLKAGAQVIYVTSKNALTVTHDVITSSSGAVTTGVGIGNILNLRQKGYDKTPLAIRFIGKITDADMYGQLNSSGYLQVKGKSNYSEMNITLEGIGEDTYAFGWGILLRYVGNVEVRNLGMALFPDDGISMDTGNVNVWLHNNDIFYGTAGGDADQAKGDGSTDLKGGSTYITLSYNHYWDSGKSSLLGLNESSEFFVTFHHNWFDHSDSRHPRIRTGTVHLYNNFFDGISKYGVGATTGSSSFVESNYFRNTKYPMMSSLQGTDALGEGTFSGEDGGMIKAYNNTIVDAASMIYANSDAGTTKANASSFDAYLASSRSETVPSSYKTLAGGTTYNNFDTRIDLGVTASDIDDVSSVEQIVTAEAGRLNNGDFTWEFDDAVDDKSYSINSGLMTKIKNYKTQLVSVGGASTPSDQTDPTDPTNPTVGNVHNFTTDGKESNFYTIQGNLSTSKGTVVFNGLTLTQALKMESSTSIGFTTTIDSTLTLVFNTGDTSKVNIDGTSYAMKDGIVTMALPPGSHTIRKADVANLFYMEVAIKGETESTDTVAPTATISYSAVNPTNKDVIVTVIPSEPVTVTNNNGLGQYTFSQNGSFTFTFEDAAGNAGSVVATVNNIDKTAPVTTDDAPNGWVNKDVTVNFMAKDMDSDVAATYYTIDNGAPQTGKSVTITSEGIHSLTYWSVDNAGNVEEKKTVSIYLDKTAPSLQVDLDQSILRTANNKPVSVTAVVDSSDSLSGIDSVVLSSIIPSELDDASEQLVGDATYGTLDKTFTLLAKKAKKAELTYSITYTAMDKAGNQTVSTVIVRVPHDQSGR